MTDDPREAVRLLGLLAEPDRLKVAAAIALGASSLDAIRGMTGLRDKAVQAALARLINGELVRHSVDGYALLAERLSLAAALAAPAPDTDDHGVTDPAEVTVLRTFLRDGRIVALPAQWSKQLILLRHVVTVFEPGVRYKEKEVNAMLRAFHSDHAMLRRALVDTEMLTRDKNVYWRSGGPVDV